jgi:hypothetical protein
MANIYIIVYFWPLTTNWRELIINKTKKKGKKEKDDCNLIINEPLNW